MTRTVARLAPDLMTTRALFDRAKTLASNSFWQRVKSVKQQDQLLQELQQVLAELQLRGDQLTLPWDDQMASSK